MEWFIANQKSLVFSAFVLCAWFVVQMAKQLIRPLANKINNEHIRDDVKIVIFISISFGVGFAFAFAYKHIYADSNLIYTGVSLGTLATFSNETIYKFVRNIVLLIIEKFKSRKELNPKEILNEFKEVINGEDDSDMNDDDDKSSYDEYLDKIKKL